MKLPFTIEEFRAIYSKVPRLNVEVIVKTESGVLLSKRSIEPWKGKWHIPGGTVYMYEDLEDAVKRVALDELGVSVSIGALIGYITYPGIKAQNTYGWPVGIAFSAKIIGGEIRGSRQGKEVRAFLEIPDGTIPEHAAFLTDHSLL